MIRVSAILAILVTCASASAASAAHESRAQDSVTLLPAIGHSNTPQSASEWDQTFALAPRVRLAVEAPRADATNRGNENVLARPSTTGGGDLTALFCALGGAAAWQLGRTKRLSISINVPEWYASDARQVGHVLPLDLTFSSLVVACVFEAAPDATRVVTRAFELALSPSESQFTPRAVIPRGPPLAAAQSLSPFRA